MGVAASLRRRVGGGSSGNDGRSGGVINVQAHNPSVESFQRALFMSTRHTFSKAMQPLTSQLSSGIRGLDFIVHSRPVAAAASTATASMAGLAVGAGAGYARSELVLGKASAGDDVRFDSDTPDEGLGTWLAAVARWGSTPAGREALPITLWLSLAEDVLCSGAELCDVNAAVLHAFGLTGGALFAPKELDERFGGTWPKTDDLNGRVLVVLGGARLPRINYRRTMCPQRRQPSVAMNGSGVVVAVCEGAVDDGSTDAGSIFSWIGQYISATDDHPSSSIIWHTRRRIALGSLPSVALSDKGIAVVCFQASGGGGGSASVPQWELQSCIGRIAPRLGFGSNPDSQLLDVAWGVPEPYAMGCRPSVAANPAGVVIAVHTREANSDSLAWRSGHVDQQPGDEVPKLRWDPPADVGTSGAKNLTVPRGAEPTAVVRFDCQSPNDVLVSITYRRAGGQHGTGRAGTERIFGRGKHRQGSAPAIPRRGTAPTLGNSTARGSSSTPSELQSATTSTTVMVTTDSNGVTTDSSDSDFDDEAATGSTRRSIVRGIISTSTTCCWQRGIDLDPEEDKGDGKSPDASYYPERSAASIADGDSRLRVSVVCSGTGQLVCRTDGGPEQPVRLQQLCFVEAHRGEDELLSDPGIRFAGCVARDEEFAAMAMAQGRVLRMWRFNQPSCLRSTVNPNYPFTDGPQTDWYLSYVDACGGRPPISSAHHR